VDRIAKQVLDAARKGIDTVEDLQAAAETPPFLSGGEFRPEEFFSEAKVRFMKRDIGQAYNMYQQVIDNCEQFGLDAVMVSPSPSSADVKKKAITTRAACLYNMACCNAAFGELESAQQCLRDAFVCGMNVHAILGDETTRAMDHPLLPVSGSVQVNAQLKRFARDLKDKSKQAKSGAGAGAGDGKKLPVYAEELDIDGMDISVPAILRRLGTLALVLTTAGTIVFWIGKLVWFS